MRVLTLLLIAACGGGGSDNPDAGPARACTVSTSAPCKEAVNHSDLAWIEANIFAMQCAFSGCHNGTNTPAGHPDLKTPGLSKMELVNMDAEVAPGRKLVVPGSVKQSYLMMMLQQYPAGDMEPTPVAAPPSDIGLMPQGAGAICCQKLDAIDRWITAGAN